MREIQAWWQQLDTRERLALSVLATFLAVFVLYMAAVKPLYASRQQAADQLLRQQQLLSLLQANTSTLQQGGSARSSGESLMAVINASAANHHVVPRRVDPDGNGMRVSVEQTAFDDLANWLTELEQQQGIHVRDAHVERESGDRQGVSARFTLE